jgi:hypothetical protein
MPLCVFRGTGPRRVEREQSPSKNLKEASASKRSVDDPLSRQDHRAHISGPSLSFDYASGTAYRLDGVLPMPLQVLQRPHWHGTPIELGDLFRLTKNRREARAVLFTHQLGWELRLLVGAQLEVVQTQVCRDQEEVLRTGEGWKKTVVEKGWR